MALYMELKRCKIKDKSWYETDGKHERVIQIFEVYGYFLGRWATIVSVTIATIALMGVLMTQINACANNMYFVDPSKTKQEWALIYGGSMVFVMSFMPRFSHFRLLNILGLGTVGAMSLFIIITASDFGVHYQSIKPWALSSQDWFNGAAIWLTVLGTHTVTFEVLEHMENPKHFKISFSSAWIWTILVEIPQSILCNLVYGQMFGQLGGVTGANIFIVLERQNLLQVSHRVKEDSDSSPVQCIIDSMLADRSEQASLVC
jgi:auxin influx carrier (AUX1 LAX family)